MNTRMRISYICFVAVWLGCTGDELVSSTLYNDLFENYNTELLPVCKNGPSHVNVSLNIALRQILILNEKEQIMTSNIWVRMGWTDCQLKWNSSHYGFY
ncbi:acetylcholine receptor subunit gamma-like [Ruditapes philippinarum]|uniref:acetylcholine receptor subunit gamma-like n=1 Tax=Ruditapes philippinarum TaxID=129788 RepID=UPI00295B0CD4|nr:acetylcholine receptor subunit gamma-like [Ruditapes philippinarum]